MRIGLINQLHGRPDSDTPVPTWDLIRDRAATAERVGFDTFVFEDALMYKGSESVDGCWESVSIAAALAASTSAISLSHSVVNSPYRSPAMVAVIASTLDEISAGRYVLGIGAGNTPESDYVGFGFPTDHRYSRFAESIEIIHTLLRQGAVDFEGEYHSARGAELVLRGPSPHGPPINIAAGGPKMLELVARYGDAWNWWGWDETLTDITERISPIIDRLADACETVGRDPGSLERTFDLYSIVPPGMDGSSSGMDQPVSGSAEEIASFVLRLGELGFDEVRCDITDKTTAGVETMAEVVELVHHG